MCAQRTFCPLLQIQRSATPLGAQTISTVEKLLFHAICSGVVVTARCLPAVAGRRVFRTAPPTRLRPGSCRTMAWQAERGEYSAQSFSTVLLEVYVPQSLRPAG